MPQTFQTHHVTMPCAFGLLLLLILATAGSTRALAQVSAPDVPGLRLATCHGAGKAPKLAVFGVSSRANAILAGGRAGTTSIAGVRPRRVLTITAYSSTEGETDDTPNINASNRPVRPGTVAVSRDLFAKGWSFGKKVYIRNMGVFTIEDLMHQRKRNQLDVFMVNGDRAQRFGVRSLEVYLIDG